jgi:hypothetical protein
MRRRCVCESRRLFCQVNQINELGVRAQQLGEEGKVDESMNIYKQVC